MPGDTDEAKVVQSQMDNMSLESQVGFSWGGIHCAILDQILLIIDKFRRLITFTLAYE